MRTVLHTESSPGLGGQEIRTLNEARWIGERGWRVIVAGQPEGRFVTRAREAGLETAPMRMRSPWDLSAVARLTLLPRSALSAEACDAMHVDVAKNTLAESEPLAMLIAGGRTR
jgi:hypothetical protein